MFPVITAFQSKGLGRSRKPAGECRVWALHRKWPRLRLLRKNMVVPAKKKAASWIIIIYYGKCYVYLLVFT